MLGVLLMPHYDPIPFHFKFHSIPGAVFSVSLHLSSELACSGGEDDKAYVWRVGDGVVVHECQGRGL